MAKRKDKDRLADQWEGEPVPYRTNDRMLEDEGIFPVQSRSSKKRRREGRVIKWTAVVIAGFISISFASSMTANSKIGTIKESVKTLESPTFKARYPDLGATTIKAYFAGRTPPVNIMASVDWPGVSTGDSYSAENNSSSTTTTNENSVNGSGPNGGAAVDIEDLGLVSARDVPFSLSAEQMDKDETHIFSNPRKEVLVYTGQVDGKSHYFSVQFIIPDINDTDKVPYLISPPTQTEQRPLVQGDFDLGTPADAVGDRFHSVDLNDDGVSTLRSWASAFAQNNGNEIKRIAGDGDSNHRYFGLGGYTLDGDPDVLWAYEFTGDDGKNKIVLRTSFRMNMSVSTKSKSSSAAQKVSGENESSNFTPTQVMDLIMANYEGGVPNVTAWGPAGTWDNLREGMNATVLTKEQIDKGDEKNQIGGQEDGNGTETETDNSDSSTSTTTSTSSSNVPTIEPSDGVKSTSKKATTRRHGDSHRGSTKRTTTSRSHNG